MVIDEAAPVAVSYIGDPAVAARSVRLGVLRLDQLHPLVSGNKWFKLKEHFRAALRDNYTSLLTFGGAHSNHLVATAAAAAAAGLAASGIVRGWHGAAQATPALQQCRDLGMRLQFVDREEYRQQQDASRQAQLREQYPGTYIIPEGGDSDLGMAGAGDIAVHIPAEASLVALAIGTGTTFAGIRNRLASSISMLGFPVMKGGDYLAAKLQQKIGPHAGSWQLCSGYHFGGFGRHTPGLLEFMNDCYRLYNLPLDFVYTAKMLYGLRELILQGHIPSGSHVVAVHTGGLQGNRSLAGQLCFC